MNKKRKLDLPRAPIMWQKGQVFRDKRRPSRSQGKAQLRRELERETRVSRFFVLVYLMHGARDTEAQ